MRKWSTTNDNATSKCVGELLESTAAAVATLTADGRIAKRNTDGRIDGQTDREKQQQFYSTLQESCCCFWSQRGRCTLSLSFSSLCYTMLCYVQLALLDRLFSSHHWQHTDICARNCEQRPSTQREERVWCHFWIASQAFGSHTLTQLS